MTAQLTLRARVISKYHAHFWNFARSLFDGEGKGGYLEAYMKYSLNSLNGGHIGDYIGAIVGAMVRLWLIWVPIKSPVAVSLFLSIP